MSERQPVVGVLALQGDFAEHEASLRARGCATRQVRRPEHLVGIDGLVLPGGESTTMLKLLDLQDMTDLLGELLKTDLPVLATCAGLILLAREVVLADSTNPPQRCFGALDVVVARNGYRRQIHSGTFPLTGKDIPPDATGVFIRAPRILGVGKGVEVLAERDGDPVLVRSKNIVGTCFHPELQPDHFVTELFASSLSAAPAK